jgi:hypothetical protein
MNRFKGTSSIASTLPLSMCVEEPKVNRNCWMMMAIYDLVRLIDRKWPIPIHRKKRTSIKAWDEVVEMDKKAAGDLGPPYARGRAWHLRSRGRRRPHYERMPKSPSWSSFPSSSCSTLQVSSPSFLGFFLHVTASGGGVCELDELDEG